MIVNSISACYDGRGLELESPVHWLVVHHCSLSRKAPGNLEPIDDEALAGPELARRFRDRALGTGGRTPYHVLVGLDGKTEQLLPLDVRGTHAAGVNRCSLGVCYVGEDGSPTRKQLAALVRVCTSLVLHTHGAKLIRHDSLPNVGKVCPGRQCDVTALSRDVLERLPPDWRSWPRQRIDLALSMEGYRFSHMEAA